MISLKLPPSKREMGRASFIGGMVFFYFLPIPVAILSSAMTFCFGSVLCIGQESFLCDMPPSIRCFSMPGNKSFSVFSTEFLSLLAKENIQSLI